jgi:SAM-dependent methyltransferase
MKICLKCNEHFTSKSWVCPHCGYKPAAKNGVVCFAPETSEDALEFGPGLYAGLASLEEGNFWFESRNLLLIWALQHYFSSAKNLIEIGCGTGFVLSGIHRELSALDLFGADIYHEALPFVKSRLPKATLFQMDARHIPFKEEFDVACAFDVIEHVEEDNVILSEMYSSVRPGGGVILTVPQHKFLWGMADTAAHHKKRYTQHELTEKVTQAGFSVSRTTGFVSLLFPVMLLSRVRMRYNKGQFDPLAELKIKPFPNRLLKNVLGAERFLPDRKRDILSVRRFAATGGKEIIDCHSSRLFSKLSP